MTPTGARSRRGRPWGRSTVALLLVATGCGSARSSTPLPTLPTSALAGYSVRTEGLDAETIASEVADPSALVPLLDGMRAGTERRFSSRGEPEQQVVARTVRFGSAAEAEGFVSWLDGHPDDVLGPAPHGESVSVGGSIAYSHDPSGCCPGKEMVWWLVAWTRETDAFVLMVGGTRVRPGVVDSLAASLDDAGAP